jgi:hypothetical protein
LSNPEYRKLKDFDKDLLKEAFITEARGVKTPAWNDFIYSAGFSLFLESHEVS